MNKHCPFHCHRMFWSAVFQHWLLCSVKLKPTADGNIHTDGMVASSGNDGKMAKETFSHLSIPHCASIPASQPLLAFLPPLPVWSPLIATAIIILWRSSIPLDSAACFSPILNLNPSYIRIFSANAPRMPTKCWKKSQWCPLCYVESSALSN